VRPRLILPGLFCPAELPVSARTALKGLRAAGRVEVSRFLG
jgi:hypothetical protein